MGFWDSPPNRTKPHQVSGAKFRDATRICQGQSRTLRPTGDLPDTASEPKTSARNFWWTSPRETHLIGEPQGMVGVIVVHKAVLVLPTRTWRQTENGKKLGGGVQCGIQCCSLDLLRYCLNYFRSCRNGSSMLKSQFHFRRLHGTLEQCSIPSVIPLHQ